MVGPAIRIQTMLRTIFERVGSLEVAPSIPLEPLTAMFLSKTFDPELSQVVAEDGSMTGNNSEHE